MPDAEDALVVNNGAAALVLATTALAAGGEVVVSRGEMVEIGDGFRLPDLIASCGARLREVGTTNRTHLRDYADAVGPDTGCGAQGAPEQLPRRRASRARSPVADLAALGPPVVHDIGSGLLRPYPLLPDEPDATTSLRDGAAVVTCSGDKLLGGPQAGIVLGRRDVVERLRRHPLARAAAGRQDDAGRARGDAARPDAPGLVALGGRPGRAARADARTSRPPSPRHGSAPTSCRRPAGSAVGPRPGCRSTGWAVALPEECAEPLRLGDPAVLARVQGGRCLLDLRCVAAGGADGCRRATGRSLAVAGRRSALTWSSSRRPATSTTASPRWCGPLTGTDPDRLPEEHRRGMTIELGHAWTDVDGRRVALVDVPGHERLVGTTLAGLGPAAGVLLVVAADEGWQAQTEEHVAAVRGPGARAPRPRRHQGRPRRPRPALADALERLARHGIRPVAAASGLGPHRRRPRRRPRRPRAALADRPHRRATRPPRCASGSTGRSPSPAPGTVVTGTLPDRVARGATTSSPRGDARCGCAGCEVHGPPSRSRPGRPGSP